MSCLHLGQIRYTQQGKAEKLNFILDLFYFSLLLSQHQWVHSFNFSNLTYSQLSPWTMPLHASSDIDSPFYLSNVYINLYVFSVVIVSNSVVLLLQWEMGGDCYMSNVCYLIFCSFMSHNGKIKEAWAAISSSKAPF